MTFLPSPPPRCSQSGLACGGCWFQSCGTANPLIIGQMPLMRLPGYDLDLWHVLARCAEYGPSSTHAITSRSTAIASGARSRSRSTPEKGLAIRPGKSAANATQPINVGEPYRCNAYRTMASMNIRSASRRITRTRGPAVPGAAGAPADTIWSPSGHC